MSINLAFNMLSQLAGLGLEPEMEQPNIQHCLDDVILNFILLSNKEIFRRSSCQILLLEFHNSLN
jgi:hypothetical protein